MGLHTGASHISGVPGSGFTWIIYGSFGPGDDLATTGVLVGAGAVSNSLTDGD